MLLKINSANIVSNNDSTLSAVLLNDLGTTPIDTQSISSETNSKDWFSLKGYNGLTLTDLVITQVTQGSTPANGEITITFTNSSNQASIGDILIVTETTIAPKAYSTKDNQYNFKLDIITKQGDSISTITTTTNDPITVNGLVVTKIVFDIADNDNIYDSLETCNYTISFFDSSDNIIYYEPSTTDIISVSFVPV
ncbi:hypothetical protein [Clostridium sp.]|uniref:hypothetical protein n=1 Tax=Clostridium sp. TaxID=1506 RepID=UPI0028FFA6B4|nr:hypothetical protein [Clostridium sp.]MDU1309958.1 hypothetical protein [Clostridium sp.]